MLFLMLNNLRSKKEEFISRLLGITASWFLKIIIYTKNILKPFKGYENVINLYVIY